MLNKRFRIDFDDIFNHAIQEDNSCELSTLIANSDQDVAKTNLATIQNYSYIYCESDNTFAAHVGREFSSSAKNYGLWGLKAAAVGVGASFGFNGDLSTSALALGAGAVGGAVIGGIAGGLSAIHARIQGRVLKTPEQKERVAELLKIAENRVAFFSQKKVNKEPVQIVVHDNNHEEKNCAIIPRVII
jgi:hypothetical protein